MAGGGSTGLDPIKAINGMASNVTIGVAATMTFVIQAYEAGLDVVVVGSQLQYDPTSYITKLTPGQTRTLGPCDFKGRVVSQQPDSQWLAKALGELCPAAQGGPLIAGKDFTLVPAGWDVGCMTSGKCDYLTGFSVNQPFALIQQGLVQGKDWDLFLASSYIPLYYADNIVTTRAFIKAHPDVVSAFTKATIAGLQYTLDNPTGTAAIASKIQGVDPAHAAWRIPAQDKLETSTGSSGTGVHGLGWTDPVLVQKMIQFLYDNKQIDHVFDANLIIDNSFLPGPK
jgi:ABC-type nitrate/sulfonate/bicarbonate transport system substrate-binding protein